MMLPEISQTQKDDCRMIHLREGRGKGTVTGTESRRHVTRNSEGEGRGSKCLMNTELVFQKVKTFGTQTAAMATQRCECT